MNIPSAPAAFVPRPVEEKQLADAVLSATRAIVVLHGPGGMASCGWPWRPRCDLLRACARRARAHAQGKTRLVQQYVEDKSKLYSLVMWLSADSIAKSCADAAEELDLKCEPKDAFDAVARWIRNHGREGNTLLVLDNADRVPWDNVAPLIPPGDCHVLVTTRDTHWLPNATAVIDVAAMGEQQALQLLGSAGNDDEARELVRELRGLPLALKHARDFMLTKRCGAGRYLLDIRRATLACAPEALLKAYGPEVLKVFDKSIEAAQEECGQPELAMRLASVCGYLEADRIPRAFLSSWIADRDAEDALLDALVRFSVLTVNDNDHSFNMHRVLQVVVRARDADKSVMTVALSLMSREFKYDEAKSAHPETTQLAPHADALTTLALESKAPVTGSMGDVFMTLGLWYYFLGRFGEVGWTVLYHAFLNKCCMFRPSRNTKPLSLCFERYTARTTAHWCQR